MKLIIAGSRDFTNYQLLKEIVSHYLSESNSPVFEIVSGACNTGTLTFTRSDGTKVCGADGLGERYASEFNLPVIYFPADWNTRGKSAGPIRNRKMAEYATDCIVFWDGASKGSGNMITEAKRKNLRFKEHIFS